jgi:aconitate hydratase
MVEDSPRTVDTLVVDGERLRIHALDRLEGVDPSRLARRPRTVRILLENALRRFDPKLIDARTLVALANGTAEASDAEIPFFPSRVLLQDFTGVPVLVDLAAMRSAAQSRGLDPGRIDPVVPVDLVVDHSVQVDSYGTRQSLVLNLDREYERNGERYALLRWAQGAFGNMRIVPPGNGIVHQVNLEYLASVVHARRTDGESEAFPDTLVGTDSHTTMINGLGVLGWGVGGIEAEAVLLGEPYFLAPPEVVGVRLSGALPDGATATDLVLTVTRELRRVGVVDRFVEFFGPGVRALSVADRATISNMCPEYGATSALFPVDAATVAYLTGTGRDPALVRRVEAYARRQGLWADPDADPEPEFERVVDFDLGRVEATVSGPRNPEEAVPLGRAPDAFRAGLNAYRKDHPKPEPDPHSSHLYPSDDPLHPFTKDFERAGSSAAAPPSSRADGHPDDGAVVIAAITSCTNTSNPSVMLGAGLIARRARELGLSVPGYVKTSLAPGSKVVTEYLRRAQLLEPLEALGFDVVGYGCTTCIGNSGPLPPEVDRAVRTRDLYVAAVLSGNRNFEARIHNRVRANFLASPMLVVAYALAGRMDLDLTREPLGRSSEGRPVYLRDLWPRAEEIRRLTETALDPALFRDKYAQITQGDAHWEALRVPSGTLYPWDARSTYLREPPYFSVPRPDPTPDLLREGRILAWLGDRVSTDHISPAGEIPADAPAGRYLLERGVAERDFNTYGARRGNHEVMVRGSFANVRLRNRLAAPREGGWTRHFPSGDELSIFEAAERYAYESVPLVVVAGSDYGQGSSRDWAAKGPRLLGVRAVVARSFERIHRSNLVGMGVLPLVFREGESAESVGLKGDERVDLRVADGGALRPRSEIEARVRREGEPERAFRLRARVESPVELAYFRASGLLPYVLDRFEQRQRTSAAT